MAVLKQSRKRQQKQNQQNPADPFVQTGGQSEMQRVANLASQRDETPTDTTVQLSTGGGGLGGGGVSQPRSEATTRPVSGTDAQIRTQIQQPQQVTQPQQTRQPQQPQQQRQPQQAAPPRQPQQPQQPTMPAASPERLQTTQPSQQSQMSQLAQLAPAPQRGAVRGEGGIADIGVTETDQRQRAPSSTRFTDFQRIIEANRPQSAELGERVAGTVTGNVTEQLSAAEQRGLSNFMEDADVPELDQEIVQQILTDPERYIDDPELFARTQEILSGDYTGPTDISEQDRAVLNEVIDRSVQAADRLVSPTGNREVLASYDERFAPGRISLDELLLGTSDEAQQTLRETSQELRPLGEEARGRIGETIDETLERERQQARDERDFLRSGITEGIDEFRGDIESELGEARTEAEQQLQDELERFRTGDITAEDAARYGVTLRTLENLTQDPLFDLSPYFANDVLNVSPEQFATQEQYDYYQALTQILGREPTFLADESVAGTADFDERSFDKDQAELGARALEIQREALRNPETGFRFGRDELGVGDVQNNTDKWQQFKEEYLIRNNLDETTDFEVVLTDQKNAIQRLEDAGYIRMGEISRNNDNGLIYMKPVLTTDISRLYDPALGDFITEGSIPFPNLIELLGDDAPDFGGIDIGESVINDEPGKPPQGTREPGRDGFVPVDGTRTTISGPGDINDDNPAWIELRDRFLEANGLPENTQFVGVLRDQKRAFQYLQGLGLAPAMRISRNNDDLMVFYIPEGLEFNQDSLDAILAGEELPQGRNPPNPETGFSEVSGTRTGVSRVRDIRESTENWQNLWATFRDERNLGEGAAYMAFMGDDGTSMQLAEENGFVPGMRISRNNTDIFVYYNPDGVPSGLSSTDNYAVGSTAGGTPNNDITDGGSEESEAPEQGTKPPGPSGFTEVSGTRTGVSRVRDIRENTENWQDLWTTFTENRNVDTASAGYMAFMGDDGASMQLAEENGFEPAMRISRNNTDIFVYYNPDGVPSGLSSTNNYAVGGGTSNGNTSAPENGEQSPQQPSSPPAQQPPGRGPGRGGFGFEPRLSPEMLARIQENIDRASGQPSQTQSEPSQAPSQAPSQTPAETAPTPVIPNYSIPDNIREAIERNIRNGGRVQ